MKIKIRGKNVTEMLSQMKHDGDREGTFKTYVEIPRWNNHFPITVRKIAFRWDLPIEINQEKGWFRKHLFIKAKGTERKLYHFLVDLKNFTSKYYPEAEEE